MAGKRKPKRRLMNRTLALGAYVRALREKAGLSQRDLAGRLGYAARESIAAVESGRASIPLEKAVEFADALGIKPSAFLTGCVTALTGGKPPPESSASVPPNILGALDKYQRSPRFWRRIQELAADDDRLQMLEQRLRNKNLR